MKHYYVESVVLAVAVVICAAFVHCSISRLADRERVVVVKRLAEREVHADKVTWIRIANWARYDAPPRDSSALWIAMETLLI